MPLKKTTRKNTKPVQSTKTTQKIHHQSPIEKKDKKEPHKSINDSDTENEIENDNDEYDPEQFVRSKLSKDNDKSSTKLINSVEDADDDNLGGDNVNIEEDDADEFTEQILDTYKSPYEYFIFDPKRYKYESHKEINIVPMKNRITSEIMSLYEYTEVVSHRAKQIENGGIVFVDIKNETDPIKIAELEIKNKKCPLSILRMYNSNYGEIWAVNELGWNMI